MGKRISLSFILIFCQFQYLAAQGDPCHLTLSGSISDIESGGGLPGATIYLTNLKTGVTSDEYGNFQVGSLCPGQYDLEIRFLGYQTQILSVGVFHSQQVKVMMLPEPTGLGDVIVEGHREEILNAQAVISLSETDLEKISGQTLAATLDRISGVNMLQTGSTISKPVIHGMHSNRVLLLLNGIRHEGQQWGVEHAPEIDPFLASEMSVIKGAATVQYGADAIGGVVMINPPELPDEPGTGGSLHVVGESNGRSGTISGRIQGAFSEIRGLAWRVQGTLKRAGNLRAPDYFLSNTGLKEADFSTALGYSTEKWGTELFLSNFNTELGILSASHTGNLTDLEDALERGQPFDADSAGFSYVIDRPFQRVNHTLISSRSFWKIREDWQLHFSYGYQENNREEYDRVRQSISDSGKPQLDFKLRTHSFDIHLDHTLFNFLSGSIGFSGLQQSNVFQGRQLIPNFKSYSGGIYAIEHYIRNRYELELGLRYDYKYIETFENVNGAVVQSEFDFSNFSTVLGGIYQLDRDFGIRVNLSTAWRPPNINELFSDGVHQGVASYEVGNPDLDSEKAFNASTSVNLKKSWINAELTGYYHYIKDFIFLEPQFPETVLTIRGAFPLFEYKQVDARFAGVDLDALLSIYNDLEWRLKASMVRARDLTNDDDLIWIPTDRIENELTYRFGESSQFKSPYFSVGWIMVREQKNYPENTDFTDPPSGYSLVNLGFGSDLILGEDRMGLHFSVENLLDKRYRDYMNRFRYFADEPGMNFIFRLNYNF